MPALQRTDVDLAFGVEIDEGNFDKRDASLDFPMYCKQDEAKKNCIPIEVNMQSSDSAQRQANQVSRAQPPENQRQKDPSESVPAALSPSVSQF